MAAALSESMHTGDWNKFGEAAAGVGFAGAAGAVAGTVAGFAVAATGITGFAAAAFVFAVAGFAAFAADKWGGPLVFKGWQNVAGLVGELFDGSRFMVFKDPLVLDLDNDGIETIGVNVPSPVLFDHNADGVKSATGWIKPDDGIVVLDRNGNGLIDSGRELFGDNTVLSNGPKAGQLAANGFEALADLDANADGNIDAQDAAYTQLRIWQDANQNGISEAGELHTLAEAGVASIAAQGSATDVNLGNGNIQSFGSTFVRTDGSSGDAGTTQLSGSLLLASSNFYRVFPDTIAHTAAAEALPDMQGSGWLRDLREAMSQGGDAAQRLQTQVTLFSQATTRSEQLALLDHVIATWADTTGMLLQSTYTYNLAQINGMYSTIDYTSNLPGDYVLTLHPAGQETMVDTPDLGRKLSLTTEGLHTLSQLNVLEVFNGSKFIQIDPAAFVIPATEGASTGGGSGGIEAGARHVNAYLAGAQIGLINNAYEVLRDSVYGALVVQTRLKPYLDNVALVIDQDGLRFDTSAMDAMLDALKGSDTRAGLTDLIELNRYAHATLDAIHYDGIGKLHTWVDELPADSPLRAELADLHVYAGPQTAGSIVGDIYLGDAANNFFHGGTGDDYLTGGAGADRLHGDEGGDTLDGGAGDDTLAGSGVGNDTYLFGRGDGQDSIFDTDSTAGNIDRIVFKTGVAPADVTASRDGSGLVLKINGTADQIYVADYFVADATSDSLIEKIVFIDAPDTVWDVATVKAKVLVGGAGHDNIIGFASNDIIDAHGGDDLAHGQGGDDTISGGDGADVLHGDEGNDILMGGAGPDTLHGGTGSDTLDGGAGDDIFASTGEGNDTYLFGRGDGQDSIFDGDSTPGNLDRIVFKAGVAPADVTARRDGTGLVLKITGTADQIYIAHFYEADVAPDWRIEEIRFTDSPDTVWLPQDIDAFRITGGPGNDALQGTVGNDTYAWGRGQGNDIFSEPSSVNSGDADRILLDGLNPDDVQLRRDEDASLVITIKDTGETLVVAYGLHETRPWAWVEKLQFADGTVWDLNQIQLATLQGSEAPDILMGSEAADTLNALGGDDIVYGYGGADLIDAGAGNDRISAGTGNDTINGGPGNDDLAGEAGDDALAGGAGEDTLRGGDGNDTYLWGRGLGNEGVIETTATGPVSADAIVLDGLNPTDVRLQRNADDSLVITINDTGETLTVVYGLHASRTWAWVEQLQFADGTAYSREDVQAVIAAGGYVTVNHEPTLAQPIGNQATPQGTAWTYAVSAAAFADTDANDTLSYAATQANGAPLPSWLTFDAQTRSFQGTPGNDQVGQLTLKITATDSKGLTASDSFTLTVANVNDTPVANAVAANQTLNQGQTFSLQLSTDLFADVDAGDALAWSAQRADGQALPAWLAFDAASRTFSGTAANADAGALGLRVTVTDSAGATASQLFTVTINETPGETLTGTSAADTLIGSAGDDLIDGLGRADTMTGGDGDDVYAVDNTRDAVVEAPGQGHDRIDTRVGYTLPANVEDLTLLGAANIAGTGNALDNQLTGNSGNNRLDGGAGADRMAGGAGNDVYVADNAGDAVVELDGEGTDTVLASVSTTLAAHVERLTLTGTAVLVGTGNELANLMIANAAASTLAGLGGNDTYRVDHAGVVVIEQDGEGTDTVQAFLDHTLAAYVENLVLTGAAALSGTGNDLSNNITGNDGDNILTGLAGNDSLRAGLGNDLLVGGDGNDRLDAGAGIDHMEGGAGNDTYVVENTGDSVVELSGEGTDTVQSGITYTLPAHVENLALTGAAALDGTGNALANSLTGNEAANTLLGLEGNDRLNGGGGADRMEGGLGNDVYGVDNAGDQVIEAADAGTDTVQASISYILGIDLENLTLTGADALTGTGNARANTLGANEGASILQGLGGDDIYVVTTDSTLVVEAPGEGTDTVRAGFDYTLPESVENLVLTGNAYTRGTGNALGNVITGNAQPNILGGLGGADTLKGGMGADTYLFGRGDGQDTLIETDATAGVQDVLRFGEGIAADQLWLRKVGNHLEVSVIGRADKVVVSGWYLGTERHVEVLELANGLRLYDHQVQGLQQAMANYAPPPLGQVTLTGAYQDALGGLIAANWLEAGNTGGGQ